MQEPGRQADVQVAIFSRRYKPKKLAPKGPNEQTEISGASLVKGKP
jgi:hypothetical protein